MIEWLNQTSILGTCDNLTMIGLAVILVFAVSIVFSKKLRKMFF